MRRIAILACCSAVALVASCGPAEKSGSNAPKPAGAAPGNSAPEQTGPHQAGVTAQHQPQSLMAAFDVVGADLRLLEDGLDRAAHALDGVAKHPAALHVHGVQLLGDGLVGSRHLGAACGLVEAARQAPVGPPDGPEDAPVLVGRGDHGRAGAVAEQHAGGAVLPVDDLAHDLGADHPDPGGATAGEQGGGQLEGVEEARAAG